VAVIEALNRLVNLVEKHMVDGVEVAELATSLGSAQ